MRLGGPLFTTHADPDAWLAGLRSHGYRAAYCPLDEKADDAAVYAFGAAARQADIVIAEVGAWSNPLAYDDAEARNAIAVRNSPHR